MLMKTYNTVEEALSDELWEFLEHVEHMQLINADMTTSLNYHKEIGMQYLNPEPSKECEKYDTRK